MYTRCVMRKSKPDGHRPSGKTLCAANQMHRLGRGAYSLPGRGMWSRQTSGTPLYSVRCSPSVSTQAMTVISTPISLARAKAASMVPPVETTSSRKHSFFP